MTLSVLTTYGRALPVIVSAVITHSSAMLNWLHRRITHVMSDLYDYSHAEVDWMASELLLDCFSTLRPSCTAIRCELCKPGIAWTWILQSFKRFCLLSSLSLSPLEVGCCLYISRLRMAWCLICLMAVRGACRWTSLLNKHAASMSNH